MWGAYRLAHMRNENEENAFRKKRKLTLLGTTILNMGATALVILLESKHQRKILNRNRYLVLVFFILAIFFGIVGRLYIKLFGESKDGNPTMRKRVFAITSLGVLCLFSRGFYNMLLSVPTLRHEIKERSALEDTP